MKDILEKMIDEGNLTIQFYAPTGSSSQVNKFVRRQILPKVNEQNTAATVIQQAA